MKKHHIINTLVILLTYSSLIFAQTYWQEYNGINIGRPQVFFSSEKGFIIAGSDLGAFKTITNGDYWEKTNLDKNVNCFTTDTTGNIYAGTSNGGVYLSNNDGNNWTERNDSLPEGRVIAITACPNGDVYAALQKGIFKLALQNNNWILIDTSMSDSNIVSLSCNSEGYLFAGTQKGNTYLSTNEGTIWTRTDSVKQNSFLLSQFIDKNDIIYKGLSGWGTFRSTDNGFHWTKVNNNVLVSFSEKSSNNFYAISSFDGSSVFGVYKSTDNGKTWKISPGTPSNQLVALSALNNGVVLVSGLNGEILRSLDYGESFSRKYSRPNTIEALVIGKDHTIFAGSFALGIYKSTNGGNSWSEVDNGIIKGGLNAMAITPNQDIFVAAQGGIFKSTNNGVNWIESDSGLVDKWTQDITVNSKGDIFVGTTLDGVLCSMDNGASWQRCDSGLTETNISSIAAGKDDYLFANCSVGGVFRSTNNGNSWQFIDNGPLQLSFRKRLTADTIGHVCAISDHLYYSNDQGNNWTMSNFSFDAMLWEIAFDNNGHLFVSTYFGSVYRSDDYGVTWNEFSNGLPSSTNVSSFAASGDGYIYAGTIDGVYKTINPVTSIDEKNFKTELSYQLLQNYPNPFNPSTKIKYSISKQSFVTLKVYDILGKEIVTLIDEIEPAGNYQVEFNASSLPSGVYFYKIMAGTYTAVRKMLLLK